ncbi:hypothetical protein [Sphingomonas jatrophae]|uniref:Uncharacterized protein n=1 Tax=Sphingomonas jatrophae TaxID=1166337 RepID=A0A1I6JL04_9SPHN|nr:hypothetical protein [Sphingomonas jatrophae]SFR79665.1 hypothetical protein SAMN05192580_0431 [Sphingomonas jatrophae]
MTDFRQGVTPAGHDMLDRLDALRIERGDLFPCQLLDLGKQRAQQALRTTSADNKRGFALDAAAFLILAVEANDAAIAAEATR